MSLLGAKRTCHFALHMSAFDPKRTFNCSALDYSPTQQPKLAVRYSPRALVTRRFANGYANHTTRSRNSRGFDCVWGGGNPPRPPHRGRRRKPIRHGLLPDFLTAFIGALLRPPIKLKAHGTRMGKVSRSGTRLRTRRAGSRTATLATSRSITTTATGKTCR